MVLVQADAPLSTMMQMIPARVLNGADFRKVVFPEDGLYLPLALNDSKSALYRGMGLRIADIKNILIEGLKIDRSAYEVLFFSADASMAAHLGNDRAVIFSRGGNLFIPVVVKVNVTPLLRLRRSLRHDIVDNYVFLRDIPARSVSDVMTFLEVNGEGAWYKAVLVDGELTFVPAPARLWKGSDLIIHQFGLLKGW